MKNRFFTLSLCSAVLCTSVAANAMTFNELGDAGELVGTAQDVFGATNPLTDIFGEIFTGTDQDLFRISISDPAAFSARTDLTPGTLFDPTLYLFTDTGLGVYADDDNAPTGSGEAFLSPGLATGPPLAGIYLLGIAHQLPDPLSASGKIFETIPSASDGPSGPGGAQPLIGWEPDVGGIGTYHITLRGAEFVSDTRAVPEPLTATIGLMGLAVLGMATRRRAR